MTIYILYSADYELYLGGNYSDETEVLINPTNDLMNVFDNLHIPLTLFADVFSILRYREQELAAFPQNAENQLKDAIRRGHDVQSHVHPHWNFTRIEGRTFTVNTEYFLLGKLDADPEILYTKIRNLLKTSRDYLQNLLGPVDQNYTCIAFRSGGYGLQPNAGIIIKALHDSGFIIDSSIVPGFILKSKVNEIDFSMVPRVANYYLNTGLDIPSETQEGIFEIPIASCKFSIRENILSQCSLLLKFLHDRTIRRTSVNSPAREKGYAIQHSPVGQTSRKTAQSKYYKFFREIFRNRFFYLDCSTNDERMFQCTKKYLDRFDVKTQNIFFSFNMHPKGMTKDHFTALENYHRKITRHYQGNIEAISYQQASEMISKTPKQ